MSDFDTLYNRLKATRERQAAILATTDKEIAALDRLMGKGNQVDLVAAALAANTSTAGKR